jgi:hypothetical protein
MKTLLMLVPACLLASALAAQNTYTATYTAGDIQSDISFTGLPGASSCPAQLTVNVPAGEMIDSAVVSYTYFSSLAGFGSPTMQRSQVRCITTGQAETQLALAVNPGLTTATYQRTINLANGPSSGPVTFEMHAGNTGLLGSPCTSLHAIVNNTWTITVHTSAMGTGIGAPDTDAIRTWADGDDQLQVAGLPDGALRISVMDLQGRLLMDRSTVVMGGATNLQLPDIAQGALLVRLEQAGAVTIRRVVRP